MAAHDSSITRVSLMTATARWSRAIPSNVRGKPRFEAASSQRGRIHATNGSINACVDENGAESSRLMCFLSTPATPSATIRNCVTSSSTGNLSTGVPDRCGANQRQRTSPNARRHSGKDHSMRVASVYSSTRLSADKPASESTCSTTGVHMRNKRATRPVRRVQQGPPEPPAPPPAAASSMERGMGHVTSAASNAIATNSRLSGRWKVRTSSPEMKHPMRALRSKSVSGRCDAHSGTGASASTTLPRAAMARLIAPIAAASTSVSVGGLGFLDLRDRRPLRPAPGVGAGSSAASCGDGAWPAGKTTVRSACRASDTRARLRFSYLLLEPLDRFAPAVPRARFTGRGLGLVDRTGGTHETAQGLQTGEFGLACGARGG
mmetsp:Transcript_12436/g.26153  ORF Transcript_12436/g.26153 Transcript_12436/m.26153 type:complete len:377 (+) Transcript_12436:124-1254(+)